MLTPFLALAAGTFIAFLFRKFSENKTTIYRSFGAGTTGTIVLFEIFYSINSQITYHPRGAQLWAYSELRYENGNWGYNELATYLKKELDGKMPALAFESKYKFIEQIQTEALKKAETDNLAPYPALIIYDGNMQTAAQLWVLDRLHIYHGWPIIKTETYLQFLKERGFDYFEKSGFTARYFIIPADKVPKKAPPKLTALGAAFEKELIQNHIPPISIKNKSGEEAFRVYKF